MPANTQSVLEQHEEASHDMQPHVDTQENTYDFAFGLTRSGIIKTIIPQRTESKLPKLLASCWILNEALHI